MTKRRKVGLLIVAVVPLLVLLFLFAWNTSPPNLFSGDATLVKTTQLDYFPVYNAGSFSPRALLWKWYTKVVPPQVSYSFGPSNPTKCLIHGLLNQCHQISNVQFYIDKNIAAGTVLFGNTNTLSGDQWFAAFTNALQTGNVEWFDPAQKTFRKDNPKFLTVRPNVILVLPPERVPEYSK